MWVRPLPVNLCLYLLASYQIIVVCFLLRTKKSYNVIIMKVYVLPPPSSSANKYFTPRPSIVVGSGGGRGGGGAWRHDSEMGRSVLDILGHRSIVRLPSGQELWSLHGPGGDVQWDRVTCSNDTKPGLTQPVFRFNIFSGKEEEEEGGVTLLMLELYNLCLATILLMLHTHLTSHKSLQQK